MAQVVRLLLLLLAWVPKCSTTAPLGALTGVTAETCGCEEPPPLPDSKLELLQADKKRASSYLPPRPNIVLLISDDVDREWLGAYRKDGQSVTPHLDRLARNGARFSNAYSSASTCAPSRYGLLTGRWPSRSPSTATFVKDLVPNVKLPDDCEAHHSVNGTTLDPRETNLALELKALGYRTGFVGKWHVSSEIAMMHSPLKDRKDLYAWMQLQVRSRGFDEAHGLYFTNVPQLRSKLGPEVQHHQEWLTDLAADFVKRGGREAEEEASQEPLAEQQPRRPFFLVMASTLPHGPDLPLWPKDNETLRTVEGTEVSHAKFVDLKRKRAAAHARCQNVELKNGFDKMVKHRHQSIRWLVQYIPLKGNDCAKMVLFDDAVGGVMAALKESGQWKDTLVVYTTDHGWSDKGFAYEGSSHVPLLLQWPRLFGGGSGSGSGESGLVLPQLVSTIDIAATAVEAGSRGLLASSRHHQRDYSKLVAMSASTADADSSSSSSSSEGPVEGPFSLSGGAVGGASSSSSPATAALSMDGLSLLHLFLDHHHDDNEDDEGNGGAAGGKASVGVDSSKRFSMLAVTAGRRWGGEGSLTAAAAVGTSSSTPRHNQTAAATEMKVHRLVTFVANGWSRAVVSSGGLKLVRNFFPRSLNRQWSREAGGVRVNPHFGSGCVHDWWATSVTKHGNFFDRHQFFDLASDKMEQRSLYRALKNGILLASATTKTATAAAAAAASATSGSAGGGGGGHDSGGQGGDDTGNPLALALETMYEALLEHTKRTKKCGEACALSLFSSGDGGSSLVERNRKIHLDYIEVLNVRNESRNFLTNWFQWTERFRSTATASKPSNNEPSNDDPGAGRAASGGAFTIGEGRGGDSSSSRAGGKAAKRARGGGAGGSGGGGGGTTLTSVTRVVKKPA